MKHMKIPADKPMVGITDEMQREVNIDLQGIIQRGMSRPQNPDERALGQFAKSYLSPDSKTEALKTLKTLLNDVGCMKTVEDLSKYIGTQAYTLTHNVFILYDGPEETNSSHWRFHISNGKLGLPDAAYYKGDVHGGKQFYNAYKHALEQIGKQLGYVGFGQFAEMEAAYAKYIENGDVEDSKIYNGAELARAYPAIYWDKVFAAYELEEAEWKHMRFIVDAPTWLRHVNSMFRTYTIDEWRLLMRVKLILSFGKFLPKSYTDAIDTVFFDLVGLQKHPKTPIYERLLRHVKGVLNLELSRAYKRTIESAEFRTEIREFVVSILGAAERRLRAAPWMQARTKATAIDKLRKLHLGVLYPTQGVNYTPPPLGKNIIENMLTLGRAESQKMLRDVRKKTTGEIWDNPVFVVNAFYMPMGNRLILPAAIVNPPFYDRKYGPGKKYGALGCVIGHEITHGFDDRGKDFDAHGNRRNWWSAADNRAYNKRTAAMEKMYNKERLLGRHIDGEMTLSENISDLGGMAVALDALKFELDKAKVSDEARLRELREFFMAYATSWREKKRVEKARLNLVVDVHSPAKYRVNNIVRHFQEWYDAFDVRAGDALYLDPDKRIVIF
jgi:putative endopeptidase